MATSLGQFPSVEEDQDRLCLRTADPGKSLRSPALDIEILCTTGTTGYPSAGITGLGHLGLGHPGQSHLGQSRLSDDHLDQIETAMQTLNGKDCLGRALCLSLGMTLVILHEAG